MPFFLYKQIYLIKYGNRKETWIIKPDKAYGAITN